MYSESSRSETPRLLPLIFKSSGSLPQAEPLNCDHNHSADVSSASQAWNNHVFQTLHQIHVNYFPSYFLAPSKHMVVMCMAAKVRHCHRRVLLDWRMLSQTSASFHKQHEELQRRVYNLQTSCNEQSRILYTVG